MPADALAATVISRHGIGYVGQTKCCLSVNFIYLGQAKSKIWFKIWIYLLWSLKQFSMFGVNTLRPRQYGRHFADDIFKSIFLNENVWIPFKISLKFVPKGRINNIPALVQVMAWCRPGDKPLSEPMMVSLPTHICVTRPQWVNTRVQSSPNITINITGPLMQLFSSKHLLILYSEIISILLMLFCVFYISMHV